MNAKHGSREYAEYVEQMADGTWPSEQRLRQPFDPCARYSPLPMGCGICTHAIMDDPPCPDLREVFASIPCDREVIYLPPLESEPLEEA